MSLKTTFLNEIYQEIVKIPGCIFEFGTYLGGSTIAFEKLRAVYEPYNHLRRVFTFDTFQGYINVQTVPRILQNDQSIIIALAYFDLAMFEPTLSVLKAILPRMLKGSLIVLDELGHPDYPSESRIFFELLAERPHVIKKSEFLSDRSFITLL